MEEQLIQQINDDISKNPTCECYHLRKYFKNKPLEEYSILRMMETFQDGSVAPGIKDIELIELLLHRVDTIYHNDMNQRELIEVLMKALDYFVEAEERG